MKRHRKDRDAPPLALNAFLMKVVKAVRIESGRKSQEAAENALDAATIKVNPELKKAAAAA
jgi:hypothetical protein